MRRFASFVVPAICGVLPIVVAAADGLPSRLGGNPLRATCCDATPRTVTRGEQPLSSWLLAGGPLGEVSEGTGAARTAGAERARQIEETLRRWELASKSFEPMTDARFRRMTREFQDRHNGHEIDILALLQRPVTAAELLHRFQWTRETGDSVTLAAVPRDATESLFVARFLVTLSDDTGAPESVRFGDRTGRLAKTATLIAPPRIVAAPEPKSLPTILQTAALKTESPAAPSAPSVLTSVQRQAGQIIANGGSENPRAAISGDVASALLDWERGLTKLGPHELRFERRVFDRVFNIEKRSAGRAWFADAAHVRVDLDAVPIASGEVSRRTDPATGAPFRIERERTEFWIWNGRQVTHGTPNDRVLWEWKLPEGAERRPFWMWGEFQVENVLPMLHPIRTTDLTERFDITLDQRSSADVRLTLKPRATNDAVNAREYVVILSCETRLPKAVRVIDAPGNIETVYSVTERVRHRAMPVELFAPRRETP